MNRSDQAASSPTQGLWRRFLLLVPLAIVLALASFLFVQHKRGTYTATGFYGLDESQVATGHVELTQEGIVEISSIDTYLRPNYTLPVIRICLNALADGQTTMAYVTGDVREEWQLEVRDGAIVEGGIEFEGWESLVVGLCIFLAAITVLFASGFIKLYRASWYGYTMVACGGGILFSLFQFLFFTYLFVTGSELSLMFFLSDIHYMVEAFAALSLYPMAPLALLVSISNISLVRHEGTRPVNLLGIAASVVWATTYLIWIFGFMGYGSSGGAARYISTVLTIAIAYGECLLLSTILCAWIASRHVPAHGVDYLIVLGCGIRADGTPSPLLAGRIDAAVAFDEARTRAGDAPVTFVPSGGKGSDELVSEAQSMATYLTDVRGIDRARIALEDRSATTRENMAFSREVIERHAGHDVGELTVAFSTTNYHVFRGYVCAHQAGMAVEGIGAKTKYYFWPNAFLREFVGLLATRWKALLQTYFVIVGIYLLADYLLMLVAR